MYLLIWYYLYLSILFFKKRGGSFFSLKVVVWLFNTVHILIIWWNSTKHDHSECSSASLPTLSIIHFVFVCPYIYSSVRPQRFVFSVWTDAKRFHLESWNFHSAVKLDFNMYHCIYVSSENINWEMDFCGHDMDHCHKGFCGIYSEGVWTLVRTCSYEWRAKIKKRIFLFSLSRPQGTPWNTFFFLFFFSFACQRAWPRRLKLQLNETFY